MIFHSVIITAGTSALAPFNLAGAWLKEQSDVVACVGQPAQWRPSGSYDEVEALAEITKRLGQLPAASEPMKVSAEYSLLHALRKAKRLGASTPRLTLICTDTFDGKLAAACIKRALERDFGAYVEELRVDDFNVDDRRRFQQGLGNVLSRISEALRNHDPSSTCFAPIGGFKVMTSLAYLLGCFHGYSSMYLHETLQVLHTIPAVPVRVSPEELEPVAPLVRRLFLEGIGSGIEQLNADEQRRYQLDRFGWLFEQTDEGEFALNAMGIFLASNPDYRAVLAPRVLLSDRAAKVLDANTDTVGKEIRELIGLIEVGSGNTNTLFHEKDWAGSLKAPLRWHLFKQRAGSIRLTWNALPDAGAVVIQTIWTDHGIYDKNAPSELVADFDPKESLSWRDVSHLVYARG